MKKLIGSLMVLMMSSTQVWAQGAIDNTSIGLTTPQAGKFTNLTLGNETINNFGDINDNLVKASPGDNTPGELSSKIFPGSGINFDTSDPAKITISAPPVNVEDSADGVEITFANEFDTPAGSGDNLAIDINGTDLFQGSTDPTVTVGGVSYDIQAKGPLSSGQQVIVTPPTGAGRAAGHHKLKLSNANGFSEGLILLDEIIASGTGGNDAFTKLLLHFDGNFIDVANGANPPHNVDTFGNVTTTASTPPPHPHTIASNVATFDGDGDNLIIPDNDDFNFGSGPFTIDFWVRPSSLGGAIFQLQGSNTNDEFAIQIDPSGKIDVGYIEGTVFKIGTAVATFSGEKSDDSITVGTWSHIALVREGSSWSFFINGVPSGGFTSSQSIQDFPNGPAIGSRNLAGIKNFYDGLLEEFRVSKGVARFNADFSSNLPAAPYN